MFLCLCDMREGTSLQPVSVIRVCEQSTELVLIFRELKVDESSHGCLGSAPDLVELLFDKSQTMQLGHLQR